ncbi:MAG: glycosyltransferase family 2 protein [Phycisphaeraceae bacterium]|nr:glycosyltransferase family 2 protein [Phycisphaeraceae bacterium]
MFARLAFIVPACNAAKTLTDTLLSLEMQTTPEWQAIVVDDGSTDGTAACVRRIGDPRITLVRQTNQGLPTARNMGICEARADYLCFLDADDIVEPAFVETMIEAIGDADLAACATRMLGPGLNDLGWVIHPTAADCTIERMIEFNPLAVGSIVVRAATIRRPEMLSAGQLFDPDLTCHEDWDAWLRMTASGARWARPRQDALFGYRLRRGSMSSKLAEMHTVGRRVIGRASVRPELKAGAQHRWSVRHLARAIAADEGSLASDLRAQIGSLSAQDLDILAGAFRHAFGLAEHVCPTSMSPDVRDRRNALVLAHLAGPEAERLLDRLAHDHVEMLAQIVTTLAEGDIPVLYGMGRNGHRAAEAMDALLQGKPWGWIDDAAGADAPGRGIRLRRDMLTTRHVVIVTPEDRGAILRSLAARGIRRVFELQGMRGGIFDTALP